MSISRETFDPTKNYKRIRYHQDRDLLDSELNEQQDIINLERRKIADILFKEGSIIMGLEVSATANVLTLAPGVVYIDGHLEQHRKPLGHVGLRHQPARHQAHEIRRGADPFQVQRAQRQQAALRSLALRKRRLARIERGKTLRHQGQQ